jgi:hypothetical protein
MHILTYKERTIANSYESITPFLLPVTLRLHYVKTLQKQV